jgi:hypothetical protein
MSTDCSFFGGSSRNPACANWWITGTQLTISSWDHTYIYIYIYIYIWVIILGKPINQEHSKIHIVDPMDAKEIINYL